MMRDTNKGDEMKMEKASEILTAVIGSGLSGFIWEGRDETKVFVKKNIRGTKAVIGNISISLKTGIPSVCAAGGFTGELRRILEVMG